MNAWTDQLVKKESLSAHKTHPAILLILQPGRSDDGRLGQMGEQVRRRRFAAFNKAWLHAALQVYPRVSHCAKWGRNRSRAWEAFPDGAYFLREINDLA